MPPPQTNSSKAHTVPFIAFMLLLAFGDAIPTLFPSTLWPLSHPQYWIKPAQTLLCGALLIYYWHQYDFNNPFRQPTRLLIGVAIGTAAFAIWISPQLLFHAPDRLTGFNPGFFGDGGWPYSFNLIFRFARLVIVVPLIEEIFWRGFVMRWLIRDKFTTVPFGTFQTKAFAVVALCFMLEHSTIDYPAALLTGFLYNFVAVQTRSLGACVVAHATTNLLLGLYVMRTGQWGFW